MRILILSWEYPPHVVGGLGRHVAALSRSLAGQGHEVHVVTRQDAGGTQPADEWCNGVHVVRVSEAPPVIPFTDLVPSVLAFNNRAQAAAARLLRDHDFDVVHAHDWLVAYAAAGIKEAFGIPLVATIHATEYGRHQGHLPGPMNKLIHQIEWWLTYEARRVVTCSQYMRRQCRDIFLLPDVKVDVVPNGVAVGDFALPADEVSAYRAEVVGPRTRMVVFAGRLEYEKGVQTVLEALQRVRAAVGAVKFFIAGIGTYSDDLRCHARRLGLRHHVRFTGFLEDHELRLLYAAADVAVAPSIYEPFGLVAVEAMACGTPVVVGDTGGLREIVSGGHGLAFTPQDAVHLAQRLTEVLTDDTLADRLVRRGRRRIRARYDWRHVGERTVEVYAHGVREEAGLVDDRRPPLRRLLHAAPILDLDEAAG